MVLVVVVEEEESEQGGVALVEWKRVVVRLEGWVSG